MPNIVHKIPLWLDSYIFDTLGAKFCKSNSDMTVIDWDKREILNYLGTYFPRSYVEARSILTAGRLQSLSSKQEISILDFGCGTRGEIIGLLTNLEEAFPDVSSIRIIAIDGNQHALRLFEKILREYEKRSRLNIFHRVAPVIIDDFYDLTVLDGIITDSFDIVISFKAICEFVTKDQFDGNNPYAHIASTYLPRLNKEGVMALVDVTSYNNVSKEWLPNMMDKGLSMVPCSVIAKNEGYNQSYNISHSRTAGSYDISKVCWRIITNK
jgi:SAM-dependent methyltransferase